MPGHRRILVLAAVVTAFAASASPAQAACPDASTVPNAANLPQVRAATLCLINEQRAKAGLATVAGDPTLELAATRYSQRMVAEGFFAHQAPDGSGPVARLLAAGLSSARGLFVGENLGYGTGGRESPASMVQAWMNSAGHRANILGVPFRAIGIGVAMGVPPSRSIGATYTTEFADSTKAAVKKAKKKKAHKKKKAKRKHKKKKHKKAAKR